MLDLDGSPPPSLPQRVDELMELLKQEQHARMHLERRLSEESSPISIAAMVKRRVEAAVEERLEMAVLQLRADFAAEFPAYRRSSYQMHAEREQEQLRAVEVIAEDAAKMLAEAEAVRLASFRDAIRSEQRQQLAQGLATLTSSQGEHVESAVATRTSPIQARLDALDVLVRGLHSRGVAVWSRLDTMEEALVEETGALEQALTRSQEEAVQTQEEMSGRLMQRCAALEDELQRLARQVSALTQETGTCRSDWRKDKEVALLQADLEAMLETTSERLAANLARLADKQHAQGVKLRQLGENLSAESSLRAPNVLAQLAEVNSLTRKFSSELKEMEAAVLALRQKQDAMSRILAKIGCSTEARPD